MALGQATLADLRASLTEWSNRKRIPDATMNDFINISLTKANRSLRIPPIEKIVDIVGDGDGYFAVPNDFIEAKEFILVRNDNNILLDRKSINEVDFRYNQSPGTPCFVARSAACFRVAPYDNPELGTDSLNLYYFSMFPSLVDDADSNWFTLNAAETILYGALAVLSEQTRDDEGTARWGAKFNEEISILQGIEDRSKWRGGSIAVTLAGSTR